jgi:preprotein translocase subunit SecE
MFGKVKNFFTGSYAEFQKVIWPSRQEVISHTLIVVISIFIGMAIIAAIDYGLFTLVQMLIEGK